MFLLIVLAPTKVTIFMSLSFAGKRTVASQLVLLCGLFFIGLNLRPALTSVAPLLREIGKYFALGAVGQGVLTTLPVLCLGLAAPLAPGMARKMGSEKAVLVVLASLCALLIIRPYVGLSGLFIATMLAGGCIGIMGVLLPGLVKRDFPERVSLMTGIYTMALNLGAGLGGGLSEPLRLWLADSWQYALMFWALPALLAALVWLPQLASRHVLRQQIANAQGSMYKDWLAWQVTLYMGLQSSLAYIVFGWLPSILADRGLSLVAAGWAMSVSVMIQGVAAVVVPTLGARMRDQRMVIVTSMLFTIAAIIGCFFMPIKTIWFWVVILGIGQGGAFSMALTLLALRAPDADSANRLSSMAQGIGYIMASMGPLAVGVLRSLTQGWNSSGWLMVIVAIAAIVAGFGAGRRRLVSA